MGIFSNNNGEKLEEKDSKGITSNGNAKEGKVTSVCFMSKETIIKGTIDTKSMFQLEGELEGDIKGELLIHVGATGKVKGNLKGSSVLIDGKVLGEIIADKVEIGETGKVVANITSDVFVIKEGGIFEGTKKAKEVAKENNIFPKDENHNTVKKDFEIKKENNVKENNSKENKI